MVMTMDDEETTELLKAFINELLAIVDRTSIRRSSLSESELGSNQKDFTHKFKEYEGQITKLSDALNDQTKKTEYLEEKCDGYFNENSRLKDEIARITIFLSESKDEYFQQVREKEIQLKSRFESEREELENLINSLKLQKNELMDSIMDVKSQLELSQIKIKEQAQVISKVGDEYIKKDQYEALLREKNQIDKKVLQLENSVITESSQRETYKNQLSILRQNIEESHKEQTNLRAEIDELHLKLKHQIVITKETIEKSELRAGQDQMNFSYKFPQVEESQLNSLAFGIHKPDQNQELMIKFEQLQNKFEEHRLQSQKETETLKKQNRDLQNELFKSKSQNMMISEERNIIQKSIRDIGSKDFSSIKKSADISDELIEKIVRMEQLNKKLKNELKVMNHFISRGTEANYQQLCLIYTAAIAYEEND
jgi:hypothetical protein